MSKGFTLIELLVVIAIVGILSAVVLASLGGARDKGNDGAIKLNLNTVRTQADLFYNTTGNGKYYDTSLHGVGGVDICSGWPSDSVFKQTTVFKALTAALNTWGGVWTDNHVMCAISFDGASYAVAVQSKSDTSIWYCLDSKTNIQTLQGVVDITTRMGGGVSPSQCQ